MARGPEGWVDSVFPSYRVFGKHYEGNLAGLVDLDDGDFVAGSMLPEHAEKLIRDRELMRNALIRVLEKYPDAYHLLHEPAGSNIERMVEILTKSK